MGDKFSRFGPCFWCSNPTTLTKDHVVPKALDGPDEPENIVMACRPCNQSRGRLLTYRGCVENLARRIYELGFMTSGLARSVARLARKNPAVLAARAYWVKVEAERWGSSPSAGIDLSMEAVSEVKRKLFGSPPITDGKT